MATSKGAVRVKGLRELQRAFRDADKQLNKDLRAALRDVAEPVRAEAEERAVADIRNIGDDWSRMRVGVTQKLVYVAPKERGRRTRGNPLIARPNLAPLLMERAMAPALESQENEIARGLGEMLDDLADKWERV